MISNVCSEMNSLPIYMLSPGSNFFQVFDSYFVSSFKASLFLSIPPTLIWIQDKMELQQASLSQGVPSSYRLDRTTTRLGICCCQLNGQKGSDASQSKTVSTTSKNQSTSWCVADWPPHTYPVPYPPGCSRVAGACSLPRSHSFYTASCSQCFSLPSSTKK